MKWIPLNEEFEGVIEYVGKSRGSQAIYRVLDSNNPKVQVDMYAHTPHQRIEPILTGSKSGYDFFKSEGGALCLAGKFKTAVFYNKALLVPS